MAVLQISRVSDNAARRTKAEGVLCRQTSCGILIERDDSELSLFCSSETLFPEQERAVHAWYHKEYDVAAGMCGSAQTHSQMRLWLFLRAFVGFCLL